MTLVDTSVWVDHFRVADPTLVRLLQRRWVVGHSAVIGELACGNLHQRKKTLSDFSTLPLAIEATTEEVMDLIEGHKLHGLGIGWIDAHLIASALLSECRLWTKDNRLARAAQIANVDVGP